MWPMRSCLNKTGPGETILMKSAVIKQTGTQKIEAARTQITSSIRFQDGTRMRLAASPAGCSGLPLSGCPCWARLVSSAGGLAAVQKVNLIGFRRDPFLFMRPE
jgi:hypothetical protein